MGKPPHVEVTPLGGHPVEYPRLIVLGSNLESAFWMSTDKSLTCVRKNVGPLCGPTFFVFRRLTVSVKTVGGLSG